MRGARFVHFSDAEVRDTLAGRKTQARFPMRPQPAHGCSYALNGAGTHALSVFPAPQIPGGFGYMWANVRRRVDHRLPCPYGEPGARVFVKETWAPVDYLNDGEREEPVEIGYRADQTAISHEDDNVHRLDTFGYPWDRIAWRSSALMPTWAWRLSLRLTQLRVERLQSISRQDLVAEGLVEGPEDCGPCVLNCCDKHPAWGLDAFAARWDEHHRAQADAWAANPYVWVLHFEPRRRKMR